MLSMDSDKKFNKKINVANINTVNDINIDKDEWVETQQEIHGLKIQVDDCEEIIHKKL